MQSRLAVPLGLILGIASVTGAARASDDAATIVKRASANFAGAKTYQGTWEMTTSMGQMGSMTLNMEIKSVSASGKLFTKMTPSGQATGMMAMGAQMANMTMVDDGKNAYMYMQAMNQYSKM